MAIRLLILLFISSLGAENYNLSIISVFRDEAPYLKEWIEFHRVVGVEHFYLINHFSEDHYREVLQPYIEQGIVELDHCPESRKNEKWGNVQQSLLRKKIHRIKNETRWLAVIDIDEFLFPVEKDNLVNFLKAYEKYAALVVNWQMYGTSNIQFLEEGELCTEMFTWKASKNYHVNKRVKSIIQPKWVDFQRPVKSVHYFNYVSGRIAVDENFQQVSDRKSEKVNVDKIRINHYWTRDIDYLYNKKLPNCLTRENKHDLKMVRERERNTHKVKDTIIWRFLPELKRRLGYSQPVSIPSSSSNS